MYILHLALKSREKSLYLSNHLTVRTYMQRGHGEQDVTGLRDVGGVCAVVVRHVGPVVVLDPRQVPDQSRRRDVERLRQTSFLLCAAHATSI